MRGLILLTAFSVTFVHAVWQDYTEERNPDPPADGIDVSGVEQDLIVLTPAPDPSATPQLAASTTTTKTGRPGRP